MTQLDANTRKKLESVWSQQNVSRETFSHVLGNLEALTSETLRWQKAINLIAPATISDIWNRHILDSFQLIPYLPQICPHISGDSGGLIDLGSGGGFPGMVLAAAGVQPIRMIDSDQRKCQFLAQTSRKLGFKTEVITSRLEAYTGEKASCLTARAVAPLDKLFGWAHPMLNTDGQMVLLKGGAWEDEVAQAQKHYEFDVQNHLSQTNADARILIISNLSHKG